MIRSIIVDDEEKAILLLRRQLQKYCPNVEVIGECQRIDEAVKLIESAHPKLVFLDIEMAGGTGFDLLEKIKERNFHVIFVTAHSEFALKAFQFSVTDYLLKPVNRELLIQAVQKVKNLMDVSASVSASETLRITSTGGVAFLPIVGIIRMAAEGPYTHIYLDGGKHYLTSHHLKQFEEHLDSDIFIRVHRSHLINRSKIKSVVDRQTLHIIMSDGFIIEVPRRSKKEMLEMLNFKRLP